MAAAATRTAATTTYAWEALLFFCLMGLRGALPAARAGPCEKSIPLDHANKQVEQLVALAARQHRQDLLLSGGKARSRLRVQLLAGWREREQVCAPIVRIDPPIDEPA